MGLRRSKSDDYIGPSTGVMKWVNKFFRFILFPFIHPLFFVIILAVLFGVMFLLAIGSFVRNGLEQYMVFDNTIIHKQIETLELYTYNKGLKLLDYSYATAVGMFQSVVSIVLLFLANGLSKAVRGETII